jgi:hypothetical protein
MVKLLSLVRLQFAIYMSHRVIFSHNMHLNVLFFHIFHPNVLFIRVNLIKLNTLE